MRKLQRGMAATVLLIAATTAQAQSIIGRVVDAKTKEPLIGAVVSLQGTDTKTVTDTDGQFHFYHLSTTTPYTLLVKYVGYKNTTIDGVLSKAEAAEDVITVALKPDEQQSIIEANQKLSKTAGAFADGNDWTAGWANWDPENTEY